MSTPTARRSAERVRQLSADDLGIGVQAAIKAHASNRPDDPLMVADDDPLLMQVKNLLEYFGGIIFTGPPGTSKTWYAAKIATSLAGHEDRVRFIQFHPSYQYEDFMEGFVPKADGTGFELRPKHFVELCQRALADPDHRYVLVIDELSRGDPGRVFGEALTYVERSKRALPFVLASGNSCVVPHNLVLLATMNPLDRGVDEVDAAFERRFAKIAMEPDRDILSDLLDGNGLAEPLRNRIVGFFNRINASAKTNPHAAVGHAFFNDVRDEDSLRSLWAHQLRFLVEKAYRLDPNSRTEIEAAWEKIFRSSEPDSTQTPADPSG